ncbi:antibiotic biosynthesis monooxygenase [Sphaerotilus sp.]|uniref:antibiotic biosynthesis monooxygenase family protein n=1 Tax=Sphaerotilus sp. TaxID=2093942 RepID=UPI0034E23AE0
MHIIIFRNRLKPDAVADYTDWADRMSALARTMPGHVSHKGFTAADGERVTIVEFESEEAMRGWATHPEHVAAKKKGRAAFYSEYSLQICAEQRVSRFTAE